MTFSIAARCNKTGMFGVAVSSSSPAVAARCAFARAGVGAVTSQNITDPELGPKCLDLMERGLDATRAIEKIVGETRNINYRQLSAVDLRGETASFSGSDTLGIHARFEATNVVCAGNLLDNKEVPSRMAGVFQSASGHLADRLLAAMAGGVEAGGESGPVHSAGLLLVDKVSWPVVNLRVDWHDDGNPIGELDRIWKIYAPQLDDYVNRAIDPRVAPSYGVPGDA